MELSAAPWQNFLTRFFHWDIRLRSLLVLVLPFPVLGPEETYECAIEHRELTLQLTFVDFFVTLPALVCKRCSFIYMLATRV